MGDLFESTYRRSLEDPEGFWAEAAAEISWTKQWDVVLDADARPAPRWFVGGELNTCYNALDRHADGERADQVALIYDSAVANTVEKYTYSELRDLVARFAGVLAARGVGYGDRVIIYMPMISQAVIAMLACARLGAVHSVVFGGFAPRELAVRIDDRMPLWTGWSGALTHRQGPDSREPWGVASSIQTVSAVSAVSAAAVSSGPGSA